jgi:hypothetical protein
MPSATNQTARARKQTKEIDEALVEMQRLAMRGIEQPESLSSDQISKMCRLAYIKLAERSLEA